jgi:hypothetical protein
VEDHADQNQAADFTRGASLGIPLFDLLAVLGRDCVQQCAAERQFLSARTIGQKTELPDAYKTAGQDMQ